MYLNSFTLRFAKKKKKKKKKKRKKKERKKFIEMQKKSDFYIFSTNTHLQILILKKILRLVFSPSKYSLQTRKCWIPWWQTGSERALGPTTHDTLMVTPTKPHPVMKHLHDVIENSSAAVEVYGRWEGAGLVPLYMYLF